MKLFTILLSCSVLAAGPATANTRIAWSDLDLATVSGAAALDARIETAARRACRFAKRPFSRIPDVQYCMAAFRTEAFRQLPPQARAEYAAARPSIIER